jgi:hypothetical protein
LRYFTPEGELVPTPAEAAQQAENRVLEVESQVQQEKQKAAKLAAKLRELGIDTEENL